MKSQDILERNSGFMREASACVTVLDFMDESVVRKQDKLITILKSPGERDEGGDADDADDEQCDAEVWDKLTRSFRQAQSVLDQNLALIQQVNENHRSKIRDNLMKNVALIGEINGNMSKVLSIYSDLSIDFSNIVHQRRATTVSTEDGKERTFTIRWWKARPGENAVILCYF